MIVDFIVLISLLVAMVLTILRAINGPTIYDRILAANVFGTITVVTIVLFGYYFEYLETLDIALIYALINFITTLAFLKYSRHKSLAKE